MTYGYFLKRDRVDGMLNRHTVIRARELLELGLTNSDLETFQRRGRITRIARGIYVSNLVPPSPDTVIAAAALRVPKGVVCLATAAYLHGLLYERPQVVWMALPRKTWPPDVPELPVRCWWTSAAAWGLPIEVREVAGVPVRVYSEAATVAHFLARIDLVGDEAAENALRRLLAGEPAAEAQVAEYAAQCRARGALERLLARRDR